MTMTRDQIEELKRLAKREDATFKEYWGVAGIMKKDGYSHGLAEYLDACAPQTILSLLALAERALKPQKGLALSPGWKAAPGVETDINKRWEDGLGHHPKSEQTFKTLRYLDETFCGDSFCFKAGGDGDNGETLMYGLDIFFESQDALEQKGAQKPLSPAMCALIESGQLEDGDADLVEPQGQALPELVNDLRMYAGDSGYSHNDYADTMRQAADALASQLALPAGPAPEGRTAIALCDEYGSAVTAFTAEEVQAVRHAALEEAARICDARRTTAWAPGLSAAIRALKSSPAVAQPDNTAAWESGELGRSAEHAKPAPAEIERQIAEAAAKAGAVTDYGTKEAAVAQPVADERDAERLEWVSHAWGGQRHDYANHVLSRGGDGDLSDIRTFIDKHLPGRAALCQPAEEGDKA